MERCEVIPQCMGCLKIEGNYCSVYINPSAKWRIGKCPMATHIKREVVEQKKINPMKQAKRRK